MKVIKYLYIWIRDGKRAPGGQWARNKRTARACPGKFTGKMGCPGKTVIYVFSGEAVPVSTFLGNCPGLPIFIKKNLVRIFSELFFFFFLEKSIDKIKFMNDFCLKKCMNILYFIF